jgi:hypothetical protein
LDLVLIKEVKGVGMEAQEDVRGVVGGVQVGGIWNHWHLEGQVYVFTLLVWIGEIKWHSKKCPKVAHLRYWLRNHHWLKVIVEITLVIPILRHEGTSLCDFSG